MFKKLSQLRFLSPFALLTTSTLLASSIFSDSIYEMSISTPLFSKIRCMDTIRASKSELVTLLNETKQQLLILIYNQQNENSLKEQIISLQKKAETLGISKIVLMNYTDARHLQTFTNILRQEIEDDIVKYPKLPVTMEEKLKVVYVSSSFNKFHPFEVRQATIHSQIQQIRSFLKLNPTKEQLQKDIKKFNNTTVIKNCYNETCVEEFKEKLRKLIELQLLRGKKDNYKFYLTTSKAEASKISSIVKQSSNKQQIYCFKNDLFGQEETLFSTFKEKEGDKYLNENQFMMFIRPRIHIISPNTKMTDLSWYITTIKSNELPTFSINNTAKNFPIRVHQDPSTIWTKGHPLQVDLLKAIKSEFKQNIQLLILQTKQPSQFFRFIYQPERYCIFKIDGRIGYPKKLIKPPIIELDQNFGQNFRKVLTYQSTTNKNSQSQNYTQKWQQVISKIDSFLKNPKSYSSVKLYSQKELQINGERLKELLSGSQPKLNGRQNWVFRICGLRNSCLYSVYQKYGISVDVPVFQVDGETQNIGVAEGDYEVTGATINRMN